MGTEYLVVAILRLFVWIGDCEYSSLQYPQIGLQSERHGAYCDDLRARGKIQALPLDITNSPRDYVQVSERPIQHYNTYDPNTGKATIPGVYSSMLESPRALFP